MKKKLSDLFKSSKKPIRFWILIVLSLISLLFFEEVYDDVFLDPLEGDQEVFHFDEKIMQFFSQYRTPRINQMMTDLTALGSVSVVVTLFVVLASVLITYKDYKGLTYISVVLAGGGIWPLVLKPLFNRTRPEIVDHLVQVTDLSFPSGHSFGAASVYVALAFYSGGYARGWRQEIFFYLLGALLIFVVGLSRIFLGVHYPTDVLAGIAGGLTWGFGISAVYELVTDRRSNPHNRTVLATGFSSGATV